MRIGISGARPSQGDPRDRNVQDPLRDRADCLCARGDGAGEESVNKGGGPMSANGNGNAVATLSDDLIAKARALASRSDELLELLEDARRRLVDPVPKQPAKS